MRLFAICLIGMFLLANAPLCAADNEEDNVVHVQIVLQGLHCEGCAKGLAQKLTKVPKVRAATVSFEEGIARVYPKVPSQLPSPKAMWELVEQAGFTPTKMIGPFGVYTKKPKS